MPKTEEGRRRTRNRRIAFAGGLLLIVVVGIELSTRAAVRGISRIFGALHENVEKAQARTEPAPPGSKVLYRGDSVGVIASVIYTGLRPPDRPKLLARIDSTTGAVHAPRAAVSARSLGQHDPIVVEVVDVLPDTAEYIEAGTMWDVGGRRSIPWFVKKTQR